jgi:hypothetical protein
MNCDIHSGEQINTNWAIFKKCPFAMKEWVSSANVSEPKNYRRGDFIRVWCNHESKWCPLATNPDDCAINKAGVT